MAELEYIGIKPKSGDNLDLPPLVDILPAPLPEITTAELERIGGALTSAAGELQPIRRPD